MRFTILALTAVLCLALVNSHPLPEDGLRSEDVNPESENRVNEIGSESQNNEVRVQFADEAPSENSQQELTPLDETEDEDENRNKRFLFGFGGGSGGAGSGNFLFDIIRLVAGSGSNQLGGSTDGTDEHGKSDNEAVPGPVTRFFVIANRGLSNLVQDLILRLAATSERFVNFKARLITSII